MELDGNITNQSGERKRGKLPATRREVAQEKCHRKSRRRTLPNVSFTHIACFCANEAAFSGAGSTSNTAYHCRVRAFAASVNSGYNNAASAEQHTCR